MRTSLSFVILLLVLITATNSCNLFTIPALMPAKDVLEPGPDVRIIKINIDETVLVSGEFIVWVIELKQEIRRLRSKAGEIWSEED